MFFTILPYNYKVLALVILNTFVERECDKEGGMASSMGREENLNSKGKKGNENDSSS